MAFLLFLGALLAIVVFALIVNRVTGTKASYLDELQLDPGESELWRDMEADFALVPRIGGALVTSCPRLRRHGVVWTDRRVVVAQKALFSVRRMVTHQLFFESPTDTPDGDVRDGAQRYAGGFYGRGFTTVLCKSASFEPVSGKECVRIAPTEASGVALNVREILIFTDRPGQRSELEKS